MSADSKKHESLGTGTQNEQRRRQALKQNFATLREIISESYHADSSTGKQQSKSEAVILQRSVEYLNSLIAERKQLTASISNLHEKLGALSGVKFDKTVDSDSEYSQNS